MAKKKEINTYDLKTKLDEFQIPLMLKKGFEDYIETNKVKISNDKEFQTEFEKYCKRSVTN